MVSPRRRPSPQARLRARFGARTPRATSTSARAATRSATPITSRSCQRTAPSGATAGRCARARDRTLHCARGRVLRPAVPDAAPHEPPVTPGVGVLCTCRVCPARALTHPHSLCLYRHARSARRPASRPLTISSRRNAAPAPCARARVSPARGVVGKLLAAGAR